MNIIQKRSFNDRLYVVALFVIVFPGMVKMLIGIGSSMVNILAFFLFILSFSLKTSLVIKKYNEHYFPIFCFFLSLLVSIYIQLNPDQVDLMSFQYFIKAFIYLTVAVLVFYSMRTCDAADFLKLIIYVAILIIIRNILIPIDYEDTNSNYLTYSFLLGASIVIILFRVLFIKGIPLVSKYFELFLLLLFLVMNLFTGSRGSLLFAFLIAIIFVYKKLIHISAIKRISFLITLTLLVTFVMYFVSEYITLNSWLLHKSERLLAGDFESEPRYEIYYNSALYFYDNFNLFGLGFNPSRYVSVSWDDSLPFLESFPWELIFNFGIFGLFICLYFLVFTTVFIKVDIFKFPITNQTFYIFLFVLLNFSKGWSVYSGFILFPLMAMVFASYRSERTHNF